MVTGYGALPRREFDDKLDELSVKDEGKPTTDTPYWPFPKRPHPYGGYEGLSV